MGLEDGAPPCAFVYMLHCADGTLYTGWTYDIAARLRVHSCGRGAKYTRSRLPVRLVYCEKLADKSQALRRECEIKRMSRIQKLALINLYAQENT